SPPGVHQRYRPVPGEVRPGSPKRLLLHATQGEPNPQRAHLRPRTSGTRPPDGVVRNRDHRLVGAGPIQFQRGKNRPGRPGAPGRILSHRDVRNPRRDGAERTRETGPSQPEPPPDGGSPAERGRPRHRLPSNPAGAVLMSLVPLSPTLCRNCGELRTVRQSSEKGGSTRSGQ